MNSKDWRGWLRALPQVTTFFGIAMIALIWGVAEYDLKRDHDRSEADAVASNDNLVRLFEDQMIRTIKANDSLLRSLQQSSVNGRLAAGFERWSGEVGGSNDFTAHIGLIDAKGILTTTSLGTSSDTLDLSDREIFTAHRDSPEAGLVIGKPIRGRRSGEWLVQLSRALRGPQGEFAGVAVASLSSVKIAKFYQSLNIGSGGAINLVGLDGVIRAQAGFKVDTVGQSILGSELLRHAATAKAGSFTSRGKVDGVMRLISYRVVEGHPLVLWVGRSEQDVFGDSRSAGYVNRAISSGLTLFILIVILINVRHRRGMERTRTALAVSEAMAREKSLELRLTLDHMNQGVMMIEADHTVAFVNRRAVELLDLPDTVHARPKFAALVAGQVANGEFGRNGELVDQHHRESIEAGNPYGLACYQRTRPNGITLEIRTNALPDGGIVRTFTDITESKRSADEIAHMAHHDPLTDLANRVLLRADIKSALERQDRNGETFALLMIDLDRFKAVNDTHGHAAGDALLKQVAQRLRGCVRGVDTIARLGGDEFAILQNAAGSPRDVEALARRMVEVISAPYLLDGSPASVGASIGIARSADSPEVEALFRNADVALYQVKTNGRNGYRMFRPEMDEPAQARRQMEEDLRQARARGEFELHYQPMYDFASGKVAGVEALLRWNHPLRGQISPGQFMALAEEIGVMASIDAWILETACTEAASWPGDIELAVNLSPAQFKQKGLLDVVYRALAISNLPARRLELEISERTQLSEDDGSLPLLRALHDLGVRIALDDFGVAQSSLSNLRAFSFEKIKIDQSLVSEMEISQESAAIVAAIAGLGRSLGAATTAEGIETPVQAELARAAGCTQAQGYLYSRPIPAGAIATLLREAELEQAVA